MEHRPLTDSQIIDKCCLNMIETYFALAKNAPGFRPFQNESVLGCRADTDHPASNFAFISGLPPQNLISLLEGLPNHIYCLPQTEVETIEDLLTRNGYLRSGELALMFLVSPRSESNIDLRTVTGYLNRFDLTVTLARLFFPKQQPHFGQVMASLVAEAQECLLLSYEEKDEFVGGAMLHTKDNMTGLYNIAIKESLRHRGYGSRLVQNLIGIALQQSKWVTLQCAPDLVPWYESLGFRCYGTMSLLAKVSL